jgi:hypothetical protein
MSKVNDVDGSFQNGIVDGGAFLERLDLGERPLVGQDRVDFILGLFLALEIVVSAGNIGVPPGAVGGDLKGPDRGRVFVKEALGLDGRLRARRCGHGHGRESCQENKETEKSHGCAPHAAYPIRAGIGHSSRVMISTPFFVTASVCSTWTLGMPSLVTTVH